jgi:two-component system, sensor histidine kinase and response regulator
MRILIVEDNEISAGILESNLKQQHYESLTAYSGAEALQMLETYWDIGLVVADIMMPEIDGLELVRRMQADAKCQEIPVIICSSLADADHVAQAARLGCKHYLLKPVDRAHFLFMVDKILSSEKPRQVLGARDQIQAKFALSSESMDKILKSFLELVEQSVESLESGNNQTAGNSSPVNLQRLVEGATTMGAQRLLMALKAWALKGEMALQPESKEYASLVVEMKLIRRALVAQMGKPVVSPGN